MSNPTGPDQDAEPAGSEAASNDTEPDGPPAGSPGEPPTDVHPAPADEPATEVMTAADPEPATMPAPSVIDPGERRFTAPSGFDGSSTQIIDRAPEPATEVFNVAHAAGGPGVPPPPDGMAPGKSAAPQEIPPRGEVPPPPRTKRRSWGWVVALILVIAALVAVAVLATVLITRNAAPAVSQEDLVKTSIESFDTAIQKGDLATLRTITCGETADSYVKYDDRQWTDTHARVAAAKQYPVVASIDQVVVNGEHAEANVTTFMAFDPATRSTRSFDLEFRDEQWKICQAPQ